MTSPKKRIFYAPTWEGFFEDSCYCSLIVMGERIAHLLGELRDTVVVDFKPHPLTGNYDSRYRDAQDAFVRRIQELGVAGTVMAPGLQIYDYFKVADLLIADVSSVVSDFLYLNRPVILTNPLAIQPMEQKFPVAGGCYVLENEPFALVAQIEDALGADSLRPARTRMRSHILGVPDGESSQEAFRSALLRIAREVPPPAAAPPESDQIRWMAAELRHMIKSVAP